MIGHSTLMRKSTYCSSGPFKLRARISITKQFQFSKLNFYAVFPNLLVTVLFVSTVVCILSWWILSRMEQVLANPFLEYGRILSNINVASVCILYAIDCQVSKWVMCAYDVRAYVCVCMIYATDFQGTEQVICLCVCACMLVCLCMNACICAHVCTCMCMHMFISVCACVELR